MCKPTPAAVQIAFGDYHDAQDMQQEIAFAMSQGLPFRFARCDAIDEYRSKRYSHSREGRKKVSIVFMPDVEEVLEFPEPFVDLSWVRSFEDAAGAKVDIKRMLKVLSQRERAIFHLYYFEGKSDREIGEKYGVVPTRINQIRWKAIRKIRDRFGIKVS